MGLLAVGGATLAEHTVSDVSSAGTKHGLQSATPHAATVGPLRVRAQILALTHRGDAWRALETVSCTLQAALVQTVVPAARLNITIYNCGVIWALK
jgi:hypothetical protein